MDYLLLTQILQIIAFCIGSILIIYAGNQDKKTRKPYLLIPALMAIGLSAGLLTFAIVSLACLLIFFLPKKINNLIGKADLLLFASILTIFILNQNPLLTLLTYFSMFMVIILIITDKKKEKNLPLILYYTQAHIITTLLTIASILIVWGFL